MKALVADAVQLKVEVDPEFKTRVETVLDQHGANLKTGVTRLLEWYLVQPASVQMAVISRSSDPNEEIWRLRHQEKLDRGEKYAATAGMDITTALRQIRELAERVEILHRAATKRGK